MPLLPATSRCLWDADLEYGLCALPALVDAASTCTLVSGRRQAGLCWKSRLANALVREALRSRLYCYDVPVAYRPRSIAEGRGVRWYHLPSILKAAA